MNRNPGTILERLTGAEQDLRRIQRVADKAVQREMLGGLLFDLVSIDKAMIREGCTAGELKIWQALAEAAWGLQDQLGAKDAKEKSGHGPPAASASAPLRGGARRSRGGTESRRPPAEGVPRVRRRPGPGGAGAVSGSPPGGRLRRGVRPSPEASADPGEELRSDRSRSGTRLWRSLGFTPRAVSGLDRANIRSLDDLRRLNGDQLMRITGIGQRELRRCEELLDVTLTRKSDYWTSKGISSRTAQFLLRAGIETLEALAATTREDFFQGFGLGEGSLRECEALLGSPLVSPEEEWMRAGCTRRHLARKLSRAGIRTFEDLQQKGDDDLLRAGLAWREIDECHRLVRQWKAREVLDGDS